MTEQPSRRELNKLATRTAIVSSAIELLSSKGVGHFTAEELADAAGISRRTFFNYFPSPEAALAAVIEDFLEAAIAQFRARPSDEEIIESTIAAVTATVDSGALMNMATICILADQQPQLQRWELMAWDDATGKLAAAAFERLGHGTNTLWVSTLIESIMAVGSAAMRHWFTTVATVGTEPTPEQVQILRDTLTEALGYLRDGFGSTNPSALADPGSPFPVAVLAPTQTH